MPIDYSKLDLNFKMHKGPLKIHYKGETLITNEWKTYWLETDKDKREFQIQAVFIKDPSKPAITLEIDISEKDVANLYGQLTQFLIETVKRSKKSEEDKS